MSKKKNEHQKQKRLPNSIIGVIQDFTGPLTTVYSNSFGCGLNNDPKYLQFSPQ